MKTILILEDNKRNMEMLVKIIRDLGDDIVIKKASRLAEAGSLLMKYSFDLFMLDIILNPANPSDVSGMKFAERRKSAFLCTPPTPAQHLSKTASYTIARSQSAL